MADNVKLLATVGRSGNRLLRGTWAHGVGKFCFARYVAELEFRQNIRNGPGGVSDAVLTTAC